MSMKMIAVACMSVLCGCAGLVRETREPAVKRLDERGIGLHTGYSGKLQVHAQEPLPLEMGDTM
jgi:hypothetical protein